MTIAVDLLPPEEALAAAAVRRARRVAGIAGGLALAGLVLGHGALELAGTITRRELARAGAELAAVERPLAALRRLRQRQAALARRLAVIRTLEGRGGAPVHLLEALAAAAPAGLWLTELSLSDGRLRLVGLASDEHVIAHFVTRLREAAALPALDLEEAGAEERTAPGPRRFVIAGRTAEAR